MRSISWRDTAELLGIAAIVASLVFVGIQLRQDSRFAEQEGRFAFVETIAELARIYNEDEEVWRKGLLDEKLTESERVTFNVLVRVYYIHSLNVFGRRELRDGPDSMDIPRRVAIHMYQYPGLKGALISMDAKDKAMIDAGATTSAGVFLPLAIQFLAEVEANQPSLPPPDFVLF